MDDFSEVKIGARLWSPIFGWGKVVCVGKYDSTFVTVSSESKNVQYSFDSDGHYCGVNEAPQSLFFEEMILTPLRIAKPITVTVPAKPEEAKVFDPNKPSIMLNGTPVRFMGKIKNKEYPLAFAVDIGGTETVMEFTESGKYDYTNDNSTEDLINIPEKIEGWVNVYSVHESKLIADKHNYERGTPIRVACIQVSFPKGEGLN